MLLTAIMVLASVWDYPNELAKSTGSPLDPPGMTSGLALKVVVEAEFDQPGVSPVSIGVKPCDFWWAARVSTPLGRTKLTYVFYITKAVASKRYEFSFQGGCKPWTVKFTNLRLLAI